jgi:hypothetical protein
MFGTSTYVAYLSPICLFEILMYCLIYLVFGALC